jgi:hypothetical protein
MTGQPGSMSTTTARRVYILMSPGSLGYSRLCLQSLYYNSAEPIHLQLITDSIEDKRTLTDEIAAIENAGKQGSGHSWSVWAEHELADREAAVFGPFHNLRALRHGHPCWRKITDPLLLSNDGDEMVLLDPDVYFPNSFRFEITPATGVLLMWQRPNCLYPPITVRSVLEQGIPLAHHVDIGVAGLRAPIDLAWLDWLLGRMDIQHAPRLMHIEAIVWAAIAMRIGGGYLDPKLWRCWHRGQVKRALKAIGASGVRILRGEDFDSIKCFHAGGEAKWWLAQASNSGLLDRKRDRTEPGSILPFEQLEPEVYHREQRLKTWLTRLGYYSVFGG